MKIVIGNQYQNDEDNNEKYTIDENGNVNLFIDLNNGTENDNTAKSEDLNLNNINNLQTNKIIQSNFIELNEEIIPNEADEFINLENYEDIKYKENEEDIIKEKFVMEDNDDIKEKNTITVENKIGDNFKEFYESIYSERESDLEEKYSVINEKIIEEKIVEEKEFNRDETIFNEKVENFKNGEINILCKLGGKDGVELKGARVNLYLLNGISPKLCDSKFTDGSGRITFSNLQNGCYRIISIVDRRYFEKPSYYNWNEVTIDKNNTRANIVIVNKLKSGYYRRQY